ISRPQKMGELRLKGMEISTTESEVAEAVAKVGGCQVGDVKTGKMRVAWNSYRTLLVQCPLVAAKKIAEEGNIKIGWTLTKVELLQARALQCFKCLERGHVQINCKSSNDRRSNCYRCGEPGHLARDCNSRVRCQICVEADVQSDHRMGEPSCRPPKRKKKI
ncbi:Cellular nucleic acid-binding protein, partial [Harpegnathos saltator]